ncbi:MAG: ABC transporter ATP-binding protein/permease [Christensenellaceae bacterium]|jgi:ATP-binding cassette subfamily B protein|nr:ABC transporter ATP-binding protein/permease [Christensenellaceae bacterium]
MKNILRIFSFFSILKWRVFGVIIVGSLSIVLYAFMPSFLRDSFNVLRAWMQTANVPVPMQSVVEYLIIFGILAVTNALFDVFCTFMILKYEDVIMTAKITEVKRKLDVVPVSFLQKFTTGDLSRRIASLTEEIVKTFLNTFYSIARLSIFFITTSIMMFMINWILAIVVVLSLPICIISARLVSKRTQKYFYNYAKASSTTYTHLDQKFSLKEFYTTHGLDDEGDKFMAINENHVKATIGEDTATAFNSVYIKFIQNFMYLLVTFLFGVLYVTQAIPTEFGALPAFIMYSNRFLSNAVIVTTATNLIQGIKTKAPRIFEILDYGEDVTQKEHIDIHDIKTGFSFKSVSYIDHDIKLLDKISFDIPQGASVAFVGQAGSGKTYLVDLLAKLGNPTSGQITVDGINLDEISSKSYYKCVGICFEQPFIFRGTAAENLLYGVRRELPENVMAVTEKLGSHEFIDTLENGYETFLTDSTEALGLGQKQALCVARLVLQKPDVAIFHQSLSATDTITEKAVYEKIMKNNKKQTTIFVTHRLASVEKCDIIYYMENGKIAEQGTHKELMAKKKKYYKAYMGA